MDYHETNDDLCAGISSADPVIDDIIAELDCDYGELPEEALRAAKSHREAITPRLIELIRNATRMAREGEIPETDGHFFALFLLTEFRAAEALPAIIEAVSLPGDAPYDLFGDAITETLGRILAALAVETPHVFDELFANRSLNEYVRSQAAHARIYLVREGRMTRDEAVERLRDYLRDAIENEDEDGARGVVSALLDYSPREALDEIEEAFRRDLVDRDFVDMADVRRSLAEGDSRFRESLEYCRPTGIDDTVEELRGWHAFQQDDDADPTWAREPSAVIPERNRERFGEYEGKPSITIHRDQPRVNRNDPCPCGTGRKYKKCCGAGG